MHIQTCDNGSFDDVLSYLRVRPVDKCFLYPWNGVRPKARSETTQRWLILVMTWLSKTDHIYQPKLSHAFKRRPIHTTEHYFTLPSPQSHSNEPTVLLHAAFSGQSFHNAFAHSSRSPQEPAVPKRPKNPVLQLHSNDPPLSNGSKMTRNRLIARVSARRFFGHNIPCDRVRSLVFSQLI